MKHSIPTPTTKKEIKASLAAIGYKFTTLLAAPLGNPKIAKSLKKAGVVTFPMHLAPHTLSGFNTCASATEACIGPCLDKAGNPAAGDAKRAARIARTQAFFRARALFLALLKIEIDAAIIYAARKNMDCAFRLNATSDIRWEAVRFACGTTVADYIAGKGATLYDYTKHINRKAPAHYNLTFSYLGNDDHAAIAIERGQNIAVVFDTPRGKPLPASLTIAGKRLAVHDADDHDARFLDPRGVVCGLRFKYDTTRGALPRRDQLAAGIASGFVISEQEELAA